MKKRLFSVLATIFISIFIVVANNQGIVVAQEPFPEVSQVANIHPVPQVPIVVDGVKMSPEKITKFNGQTLFYLVDDRARSEGVVLLFTTLMGIEEHIKSTARNLKWTHAKPSLSHCTTGSQKSLLYGLDNYQSFLEDVGPDEGFNLLGSANNETNSVKATRCNEYTKLYDGDNLTGSSLWLACCGDTPSLGIYGWNNRASSVRVTHYGS